MTGFVYKWTNAINGKWYIGSHKGTPDDGYRHSSSKMEAAEEKYGIKNFTREILFEGDYHADSIKAKEAEYLTATSAATNRMSYNMSNITGPNCFSEETIQKLSGKNNANYKNRARRGKPQPMQGKTHTKEARRKIAEFQTGRKHTEEVRQKISEGLRGKPVSTDTRNKIAESLRGRPDEIVSCPHCQKQGGNSAMKRWHFNNCKHK